jgi:hypothetical protein
MAVRRESKHEVIEALRRRYRGVGRAEKGRLIDEAAAVTGYHRRYAQALLRAGSTTGSCLAWVLLYPPARRTSSSASPDAVTPSLIPESTVRGASSIRVRAGRSHGAPTGEGAATRRARHAGTPRIGPEPAPQGRLLVPANERAGGGADDRCVPEQHRLPQRQRLPADGRHDRQVHGVTDVAVEPADDEPLRRRERGRGAEAFPDELHEGVN